MIHVLDVAITLMTYHSWDLWRVIDPAEAEALKGECSEKNESERYYGAWFKYFLLWVLRSSAISIILSKLVNNASCEPILSVIIIQDFYYTLLIPLWVLIEKRLIQTGRQSTGDAVLLRNENDERKHFHHIRFELLHEESVYDPINVTKEDKKRPFIGQMTDQRVAKLNKKLVSLQNRAQESKENEIPVSEFEKNKRLALIKSQTFLQRNEENLELLKRQAMPG